MPDLKVHYEEWIDIDPGWLVVHIQRTDTGEVLSAFTEPSPKDKVMELLQNLEAGRRAETNLEFIAYFCPETGEEEEINDDLHVVKITGSMRSEHGRPLPQFYVETQSLIDLILQVRNERDPIDLKISSMLALIAPESFSLRVVDLLDIDTASSDDQKADMPLEIRESERAVYWAGERLKINANTHFDLLLALHKADGAIVKHPDLHRAIRPRERPLESITATTDEIREALKCIRAALRQSGCPLRIECVKRLGYRLPRSHD